MSTSVLNQEIREQPAAITRLIERESAAIARIGAALVARNPAFVAIAARGTSDNAARYAQYVFGAKNRSAVALATPSLYSQYASAPRLDGAAVFGISQSGQSPDIVAVLDAARAQGSYTIAVTNEPASPLAKAADVTIALHAGAERSVAATKTYTLQLTALAMLSAHWRGGGLGAELPALGGALTSVFEVETQIRAAAAVLAKHDHCVVLGRGYNYCTAFEIALKIKELAYVLAEPYSTADFMHGPLALIETGFPVVLVAAGAVLKPELDAFRASLLQRKALLITLGDHHYEALPGEQFIPLRSGLSEWLSPIGAVIPGQLLAYHTALARGVDPDQPRTISKVTLTR
jgi:glutamine---fructose-6-phosphate transaminase (isomerizing)